jgi:hypothetical protein
MENAKEKARNALGCVSGLGMISIVMGLLPLMFSAMLLDSPYADWKMYLAFYSILLWIPAWIVAWILSLVGYFRNSLRWLWGLALPAACLIGFIIAFSL